MEKWLTAKAMMILGVAIPIASIPFIENWNQFDSVVNNLGHSNAAFLLWHRPAGLSRTDCFPQARFQEGTFILGSPNRRDITCDDFGIRIPFRFILILGVGLFSYGLWRHWDTESQETNRPKDS